jgi:Ni,Fe-hydrogenase III large subunit
MSFQPVSGPAADESVTIQAIVGDEWHAAVGGALDAGWRFAALYACDGPPNPVIRMVATKDAHQLILSCRTGAKTVPTIIDLVPAAAWDEREAHDLYGWQFPGHEPLRPLVEHPSDPERWTVPLYGHDAYQVAVGPIHAGVIESGHFRFHVVGERILHVDLQLFYKHRGLETAAQGRSLQQGVRYLQRACAADAVTNAVAYAQACEEALGRWPEPNLRRARTLLLEFERLYNHLNDIAAICAGVGFAAGNMLFASLKERAQRLNQQLTGHRFLFDSVEVGISRLTIEASEASELRKQLRSVRDDVARAWHELQFVGSLQERLGGVGVIGREHAERYGALGPVARASGVAIDARSASPRLWYSGFVPAHPPQPTGDVAARLEMRGAELPATFDLLDELLARPLAPAGAARVRAASRLAVGVVESPRGRTVCCVESDDERIARVHLRTGSYANWPILAHAVRDELLPDFPLINKSFELCYACVDR